MGRKRVGVSLFTAFLALLIATAIPGASSWADPTACKADRPGLGADLLRCWSDAAKAGGGRTVVVTLHQPLRLDVAAKDLQLVRHKKAFKSGELVVTLPPKSESGAGGTVLLVLAGHRIVGADSVITQLDNGTVAALKKADACDALCNKAASGTVRGSELIKGKLAADRYAVITPETEGSGPNWVLVALTAALAALVLVFAWAVRRSKGPKAAAYNSHPPVRATGGRPAAAAPLTHPPRRARRPAVVPAGPLRSAVVRTELHPQGYVELDHCLHRATWADDDRSPALGCLVDVAEQESGVLLAFPSASRETRRSHAK
ncbi:hypothetical protein [Streptomyces sp.]|uniref:hypothetical protein n=1 Tax=Streptomyces sp. TaxID=1931 RepID=UPI002D77A6EB|nr:hypothetical protein [Streptomyces sp.]HET6354189.1 hypothetical protein [Streptomyces sp.]